MSQNQTKRILVAGGGGFIGGHLAGSLLAQGHQVVVADIKSLDQWYQAHENAENHVLNLEEKQACYQVMEGCDEVYNLAAQSFVATSFQDAFSTLNTNINGTHYILAALHDLQKFLVEEFLGWRLRRGKAKTSQKAPLQKHLRPRPAGSTILRAGDSACETRFVS